ncbi:hypothetical protein D3C86_1373090 [compost metagenome]
MEDIPSLSISLDRETLETWRTQEWLPAVVREQITRADVLLVPDPDFRGLGPAFAPDTGSIYSFLKKTDPNLPVVIASDPYDYREYVLHSVLLDIGIFIVSSIAAPVLVNLVSEYLKGARSSGSDPEVRFNLKVDQADGSSIHISYAGPASSFDEHVMPALKSRPGMPVERNQLPLGSKIDIRM